MVVLRQFQPDDAPALLALFRDTVRRVNSRDYSPAQVTAWASDEIDPVAWAERFSGFYSVWEWEPDVPGGAGRWLTSDEVGASTLPAPVRILLLSVLATLAMKTT